FSADWQRLRRSFDLNGSAELLAGLDTSERVRRQPGDAELAARLASADSDARAGLVTSFLQTQLARIAGLSVAEVDAETPLDQLGIDSLLALELLFSVEAALAIRLPMEGITSDTSIAAIAAQLVRLIDEASQASTSIPAPVVVKPA